MKTTHARVPAGSQGLPPITGGTPEQITEAEQVRARAIPEFDGSPSPESPRSRIFGYPRLRQAGGSIVEASRRRMRSTVWSRLASSPPPKPTMTLKMKPDTHSKDGGSGHGCPSCRTSDVPAPDEGGSDARVYP
jgi:hypothetical protein